MERPNPSSERGRNIIVGITALGGLVGFMALLVTFGYLPAFLNTRYNITVYMEDVAGLREGSRVMLWGQEVGRVRSVGFAEPGDPDRAFVVLAIDEGVDVPGDVQVRVETPLLAGGPVVSLVGSSLDAALLAKDGNAVLTNSRVVDPLMQLEVVSGDLAELKDTWVGVGENINELFGGEGEGTPSLPRVVMGLEGRLEELKRVFAGAEAWLGDEELRNDVTQTAENARKLSDTLEKAVASLEERYLALAESAEARLETVDQTLEAAVETIDGAASSIGAIETNYVALADDAAKVVSVIDRLVKRADSKDSTIGMLLSDPQLYHNLTDTAERIKLMTDEARLLIEKWKAEGLPLRVFN
ncbi:MAG: MlaD family protein [Planctomycetota bacterium]